jgi:hypothetical protein
MSFIHLQIEWNLCLGGYRPQIPVLFALYPQLNLLNTPPPPENNSWYATVCMYVCALTVGLTSAAILQIFIKNRVIAERLAVPCHKSH